MLLPVMPTHQRCRLPRSFSAVPTSLCLLSIKPSVYRASRLPSGTSKWAIPKASPPKPSRGRSAAADGDCLDGLAPQNAFPVGGPRLEDRGRRSLWSTAGRPGRRPNRGRWR